MSEDDPFENLDPPEDREGDPFEKLGPPEEGDGDTDSETPDDDGDTGAAGPEADETFWDEMQDADRRGASDSGSDGGDDPGPDRDIEHQPSLEPGDESDPSTEQGSEPASDDGEEPAFEETFIEEDAVAPDEGPAPGSDDPFDGLEAPDSDPFGEGESVFEKVDVESLDADELWALLDEDADESAGAVNHPVEVSKHRFCEQCEFFAEPPGSHCTHAEAEILEYIGMENVRVVDCPIVAEQRELENEE